MKPIDLKEIHKSLDDLTNWEINRELGEVSKIREHLEQIKKNAILNCDEETAKLVWCYKQILSIQEKYIQAFENIKSGNFYKAWCLFEVVEIKLHHLEPHFSISGNTFQLKLIDKHIRQFQSLYPYRYFISPGYLISEALCSICGKKRSIRNPCEHILGEIYEGEMCCREVTKANLLEVSFVKNPAQKYSVIFGQDPKTGETTDNYDYSLVNYVGNGLRSPFDEWESTWTQRRHPHSRYKNVGHNNKCPCESNKKYKKCCLNESGVLRPHLEIRFSVPPPENLPPLMYTK